MANFTIPTERVPGVDQQQGSRILNAIRRGSIKLRPQSFYHKKLTYTDFAAAALNKTIVIGDDFPNQKFPANVFVLDRTYFDLVKEFSGGSVATADLEVGNAGDHDGLIDGTNVFTGAGTGIKVTITAAPNLYGFQAALDITATLTVTGGNTNTLTQGEVVIYIPTEAVARSRA